MSKKQKHRTEELMLIPFLDILCSLIGVLVLIIVVLVVAQTQRIRGRTQEEVDRAQEHLRMLKTQKENVEKFAGFEEKLAALEKAESETKEKKREAEKLKEMLSTSEEARTKNQSEAAKLKKQLEDLLTEIRGLTGQEPPLKQKIAELQAALAKLQRPEKKDPTVVVHPGGSGLSLGNTVFFIDAAGDKLTYYWNEKTKSTVSAVPETIVADAEFNAFLNAVKSTPQSKLIFLMREDGAKAYNLGAGWAQSKHGYKVEQMGRLPVPGSGEIDTRFFGKIIGNLQPPPKPTVPPGASTPGAPMQVPGAPTPMPGAPPAPVPPPKP